MIEEILPASVIAVEMREDADVRLFPEEELALGHAVKKRRREFTTARACARIALRQIGVPPCPIPAGERGEPLWPAGVVGSITHCHGYRACAVARSREIAAVGIDAEPHAPLPSGLLGDIGRPEELRWLSALRRRQPQVHWDRLLFSAKEAVYKTWYPLAGRWLGFEDATLTMDLCAGTFVARLLVAAPALSGGPLRAFEGRWMVRDGIVLTAVAMSVAQMGEPAPAGT